MPMPAFGWLVAPASPSLAAWLTRCCERTPVSLKLPTIFMSVIRTSRPRRMSQFGCAPRVAVFSNELRNVEPFPSIVRRDLSRTSMLSPCP